MIPKILIVEDNPVIARMWQGKLIKADFEVRIAPDGQMARQTMQEWQPDVILLDVILPDTDGLSLCREWRSESKYNDVKIIFVSAITSRHDIQAAKIAGANGYLPKSPTTASQLVGTISKHLKLPQQELAI